MKFLSSVVAAVILMCASSAHSLTQEEKMRLLSKAVPFSSRVRGSLSSSQRQLQENNLAITAAESIQFNACVSLSAMPENEDQATIGASEELRALFEAGDIVSQTSVVLFSICETGDCALESEENLYVVSLQNFMQLTAYRPQKTFDYCEACMNAQEYCANLDAAAAEDENAEAADEGEGDAAAEADGGEGGEEEAVAEEGEEEAADQDGEARRKLQQVSYVSCATCSNLGCFKEEENELSLENMVAWVQQQTQCQATGQYWNEMALYSSFMCNQAGDGVEIALFFDNDCQLYTASTSFSSLYPDDMYIANSQNVVTWPFLNDVDCAADPELRSPEEEAEAVEGEQQQQNGEENANAYCQQLLNEGNVLAIDNCYANGNQENQEADANYNEDYYDFFSQYNFNLNGREDINNPAAVCSALKNMQGEYVSFKQTKKTYNSYKGDNAHSGQNYNYKKKGDSSLSGGAIAGIVIAVLTVLVVGLVVARMLKKKQNAKREPLVTTDGGYGA